MVPCSIHAAVHVWSRCNEGMCCTLKRYPSDCMMLYSLHSIAMESQSGPEG